MPAHVHADLMKQYYEDALETDKPWERWQFRLARGGEWIDASAELAFSPNLNYRRKPTALCQVEGRDVFPGDKLWHKGEGEAALTAIVRSFVEKHHVSCPETIHQTDRVIENAYGLIEDLCNVVGYYRYPDDEETD